MWSAGIQRGREWFAWRWLQKEVSCEGRDEEESEGKQNKESSKRRVRTKYPKGLEFDEYGEKGENEVDDEHPCPGYEVHFHTARNSSNTAESTTN